jgi:hypothetical protein
MYNSVIVREFDYFDARLEMLYDNTGSSSRHCAGICGGVSIVTYNDICRIHIRSIHE